MLTLNQYSTLSDQTIIASHRMEPAALTLHSDEEHSPLSTDEITTINCQDQDKKISSRYTQLRKQLRSCEHFKENYFVLEVNKPTAKSEQQKRKRRKKASTVTTTQNAHPDESLSNDGCEEMKKKKRKKNNCGNPVASQPVTTTTEPSTPSTSICTTIEQEQIAPSTCVNTTSNFNNNPSPNDILFLQLANSLLQPHNEPNSSCQTATLSLQGLEMQIKLLQRLQETINLLKGSPSITNTQPIPTTENPCTINATTPHNSSDDIFQQTLDFGDVSSIGHFDNNHCLPLEMNGVSSCEDFSELLNSFI